MKPKINEYFKTLQTLFDKVLVTDSSETPIVLTEAIERTIDIIIDAAKGNRKVIFIGNGASASISSHTATDLWKSAGVRAMSFNDNVLLTCISNDYGYEHVFEKPIEAFIDKEDILIAISSSGQSENILRGVGAAKKKGASIITFSGFNDDNPLRRMGELNFYIESNIYGYVEVVHLSICHCLTTVLLETKNG